MPRMLTLKERMEGFGGRVSATRVKFTVAVPVPQLVVQRFLGPLQAARDKTVSRRTGRSERVLLRFMWPPRQNSMRSPSLERKTLTIPTAECNAAGVPYRRQKKAACSTLKCLGSREMQCAPAEGRLLAEQWERVCYRNWSPCFPCGSEGGFLAKRASNSADDPPVAKLKRAA